MGQASKLALRASMSLAATGATGSYPARLWRLCVMAAALSLASAALAQGATAVRQLASPALAVKAGRQRGLSVLEKRRQEEQQEMAAAKIKMGDCALNVKKVQTRIYSSACKEKKTHLCQKLAPKVNSVRECRK